MFHLIWYIRIGLISGFVAKSVMHGVFSASQGNQELYLILGGFAGTALG